MSTQSKNEAVLCSACFKEQGLRINAERFQSDPNLETDEAVCQACRQSGGRKLSVDRVGLVAHSYFVRGSMVRLQFGFAPRLQINTKHDRDFFGSPDLEHDMDLIERVVGLRPFLYGPRMWMIGAVEPLEALERVSDRPFVINRVMTEYPQCSLGRHAVFYRLRKNPVSPHLSSEYDSPPTDIAGSGRLDPSDLSVMYASEDLQVCFHECRVSAEDDLYVATMSPTRPLNLLDLSVICQKRRV